MHHFGLISDYFISPLSYSYVCIHVDVLVLFNIKRLLSVRLLFLTVTKMNYLLSATCLPNDMVYIRAIF